MNKNLFLNISIMLLLCLGFYHCKEEKSVGVEEESDKCDTPIHPQQNLNISILLDLSDRINPEKYPNPSMEFYQRDAKYIQSVANAFYKHVSNKKLILINDKIQLYFNPEPNNSEINQLSKSLKFNLSKQNTTKEKLLEIKTLYDSIPLTIYESAITDNAYVGSDTWRFFKDKVTDYCISTEHRNILIILTDGYIYHKNSLINEDNKTTYLTPQFIRKNAFNSNYKEKIQNEQFGFIPANHNLKNLEVLVLGINVNNDNPFEKDVVLTYWSNWFSEMGIEKFEIKDADLPSNLDCLIQQFILSK